MPCWGCRACTKWCARVCCLCCTHVCASYFLRGIPYWVRACMRACVSASALPQLSGCLKRAANWHLCERSSWMPPWPGRPWRWASCRTGCSSTACSPLFQRMRPWKSQGQGAPRPPRPPPAVRSRRKGRSRQGVGARLWSFARTACTRSRCVIVVCVCVTYVMDQA